MMCLSKIEKMQFNIIRKKIFLVRFFLAKNAIFLECSNVMHELPGQNSHSASAQQPHSDAGGSAETS